MAAEDTMILNGFKKQTATKGKGPLLKVTNLTLHYRASAGIVQAVDHIDFEVNDNEAIVILGESGCGKSSLSRAILRLLPRNTAEYGGSVVLGGDQDIMNLSDDQFRDEIRWVRIAMVPQAAMNSLNPVLRV